MKTQKIKRQDLVELQRGLVEAESLSGAKFTYAVARNLDILKKEMESIQKVYRAGDDFMKYEEERIEIGKKHADKNEDGSPKTIEADGFENFDVKDVKAFEKDLDKLQKKYKEVIATREKELADFQKFMEEDVEIDLYTVQSENIPDEINVRIMAAIFPIVEE